MGLFTGTSYLWIHVIILVTAIVLKIHKTDYIKNAQQLVV